MIKQVSGIKEAKMNETQTPSDMIDTTDCYETVNAFRHMKNLLFAVILICLLVSQGIFWLGQFGHIDQKGLKCPLSWHLGTSEDLAVGIGESEQAQKQTQAPREKPYIEEPGGDDLQKADELKEQAAADAQSMSPESGAKDDELIEKAQQVTVEISDVTQESPSVEQPEAQQDSQAEQGTETGRLFSWLPMVGWRYVFYILKLVNFLLAVGSVLYCLILLTGMKISLAGRLGGLGHVSKAFIMSLFVVVLILPWQNFFPWVAAGVIYTPDDLFCRLKIDGEPGFFFKVFYYARFTGLWVIVMILLVRGHIRSGKWSKAILRRLGMKS